MYGIFTYISYKDQPNVGIHIPYMNPLGKALPPQMCWENAISNTVAHGMNETFHADVVHHWKVELAREWMWFPFFFFACVA